MKKPVQLELFVLKRYSDKYNKKMRGQYFLYEKMNTYLARMH